MELVSDRRCGPHWICAAIANKAPNTVAKLMAKPATKPSKYLTLMGSSSADGWEKSEQHA
jgi:hypothetical protein